MAALEILEEVGDTLYRWTFGPTHRERVREAQQQIRQAQREVERERWTLKQRHEKLINELKAAAKTATCAEELRPLACEISRAKGALMNVDRINRNLDGIVAKVLSASTNVTISNVLQSTTEALSAIQSSDGNHMMHTMKNFEKELYKMEDTDEMLGDMVGFENEETDADEILGRICDEADINLRFELPTIMNKRNAPLPAVPTAQVILPNSKGKPPDDLPPPPALPPHLPDDLLHRFNKLRHEPAVT